MKKLVTIENDQVVTTSLKIAEVFEKRHDHVIADIRNLIKQMGGVPKIGETPMFQKSTYIHEQNGQEYPMYYINRDGFTLLAMGFTGKKALEFKVKYIKAFNQMEEMLNELLASGKDTDWLEARADCKLFRKKETSVIKLFIEYARAQGCKWEDKYFYSTLTIWVNEGAGLPKRGGRDGADKLTLNMVAVIEGKVLPNIIRNGMADGLHWTQIWAKCQQQINHFYELTGTTRPLIKEVA